MSGIEKLKLYLETTFFNYYFDVDRKRHEDVIKLCEAIAAGQYIGYTSDFVVQELRRAPEPKRSAMLALIDKYGIAILDYASEAVRVAEIYIEAGIIPMSHRLDSLHVAMATVYRLDCIISYNFQHINRNKTRLLTTSINNTLGYGGLIICTAKEVLNND